MSTSRRRRWAVVETTVLIALLVSVFFVWQARTGAETAGSKEGSTTPAEPSVHYLPYEEASAGLPVSGTWRGDPVLADVDLDGNLDIVASLRVAEKERPEEKGRGSPEVFTDEALPEVASGLYVFLGDGSGQWRESREGIPPALGYGGADVEDFNGDGLPDIAFSTHTGPMRVFLGGGDGTWEDSSHGIDNAAVIHDLAAADFTGDGFPDLAGISMFHKGGGIHCYRNLGNSAWEPMHEKPLMSFGLFGQDMESCDIDGDGDEDFAATTSRGLKVFLNMGGGEFEESSLGLPNPRIGNSLTSIAFGDLTNDGRPELVVGAYASEDQPGLEVYASRNKEDGEGLVWKRIYTGPHPGEFVFGLALGDLDNDGDLDLVTAGVDKERGSWLTVYEKVNDGLFQEKGCIEGGKGRARVKLGDCDNDGRLDVLTVFAESGGGIQVFLQK